MRLAGKETEIKLVVRDPAAWRRRLRRQGFRVVQPRAFEQNTLFDTPARTLRRRGLMVRLRSVNGRHWLTFKGRAAASRRYKVRAEFETELADARTAGEILAGLGFEPVFRYEKFRTVYQARARRRTRSEASARGGGEVLLDETPIGNFAELEGSRSWILRVAQALGATPDEFITKTYAALYADWCRQMRRPFAHMVFRR